MPYNHRLEHSSSTIYVKAQFPMKTTSLSDRKPTGQFSGHETFPLRQLWLPKIARLVNDRIKWNKSLDFTSDKEIEQAMLELGLGKNMVSSARFWAQACGILKKEKNELTDLGTLIFGDAVHRSLDPFCSNPATVWVAHWNLASNIENFTPAWYLFNLVNQPKLDRQSFVDGMKELCRRNNWKVSDSTLSRAQECTLRAYLPGLSSKGHTEDFVEPLLSELGLLETTASHDVFAFCRGPHPTLPNAVFIYALMQYWAALPSQTASLDFARIAHDYGSPGRVFKLDADSIARRLQRLNQETGGLLEWTEQAGLRQVIRRGRAITNPADYALSVLGDYYRGNLD